MLRPTTCLCSQINDNIQATTLYWASCCLDVFSYLRLAKSRASIAPRDGYAAPAAHRIASFLCSLFYRICCTCALPREYYFAPSLRSLMVCCRQTMVCREQTMINQRTFHFKKVKTTEKHFRTYKWYWCNWAQLFITQPYAYLYQTNMRTFRRYIRKIFSYNIQKYNYKAH